MRDHGDVPPPHVRPARGSSHRRRAGSRRVRLGHRLPRHDLRRAAERAEARHGGVGRGARLVPRRHRQPRRRHLAGSGCAPGSRPPSATTTTATSAGARSRSRRASTCPDAARFADWHSPVTVSMSVDRDRRWSRTATRARRRARADRRATPRARVGAGRPRRGRGRSVSSGRADLGRPGARRPARSLFADVGLGPHRRLVADTCSTGSSAATLPAQRRRGDGLHRHRLARRRRSTPLADRVPLAIVTDGRDGALGHRRHARGEEAPVPAAAGRGHRPDRRRRRLRRRRARRHAGRVAARAADDLRERCAPASRSSSSAARSPRPAGATSRTGGPRSCADTTATPAARSVQRRFAFLDDIVAEVPSGAVRRATATIAKLSDVWSAPAAT